MSAKKKAPAKKRGPGRPQKEPPDQLEQVERMAAIGCTDEEIAQIVYNLSPSAFSTRKKNHPEILEAQKRGSENLKSSIRRAQYVKGVKEGHPTMLIWLGKQYLGQSDRAHVEAEVTETRGVLRVPVVGSLDTWYALAQQAETTTSEETN